MTISNPDSLSSRETEVNHEIRSLKNHLSGLALCQKQKAIGGIYFPKMGRAETLQSASEFDNFKSRFKSGTFKWISWLIGLFFGGDY
jgi:hypothetical protein